MAGNQSYLSTLSDRSVGVAHEPQERPGHHLTGLLLACLLVSQQLQLSLITVNLIVLLSLSHMAQGDLSDSDPFFNLDDDALHYCVNRLLCLTQLHSFSNDWHRGILLAQDPLKYQTWKTIDRTESSGPPYCGWPRELKPSSQTIPTVQPDAADPSSQKEQRERQEKRIEIFKDEKRYLVGETGPHTETRGPTNGWLKELRYTLGIYFNQPWTVHALVACCCIGGAVQGWDEAAVNGGTSLCHAVLASRTHIWKPRSSIKAIWASPARRLS